MSILMGSCFMISIASGIANVTQPGVNLAVVKYQCIDQVPHQKMCLHAMNHLIIHSTGREDPSG